MQINVGFAKKIPIVKIVYSVNIVVIAVQHFVRAPKKVIVLVLTVIVIPVVYFKSNFIVSIINVRSIVKVLEKATVVIMKVIVIRCAIFTLFLAKNTASIKNVPYLKQILLNEAEKKISIGEFSVKLCALPFLEQ